MLYKPSTPHKPNEPTLPEKIIRQTISIYAEYWPEVGSEGLTFDSFKNNIVSFIESDSKYLKPVLPIDWGELKILLIDDTSGDCSCCCSCPIGKRLSVSYIFENSRYDYQLKKYHAALKKYQIKIIKYNQDMLEYKKKVAAWEEQKKIDNVETAKKRKQQLLKELAKLEKTVG